jgi:hypothetical protein
VGQRSALTTCIRAAETVDILGRGSHVAFLPYPPAVEEYGLGGDRSRLAIEIHRRADCAAQLQVFCR